MSLISRPLFTSDNVEQLATADAYDISDTRPINKLFEAAKGVGDRLFDRAGGIRGIANGIASITQAKAYGVKGRALLESGLGVFGTSSAGIIRTASASILDKAGEFLDLNPEMVGKIKSATESVAYQVQYGDPAQLANYGDLASLIGSLTGNEALAEYINVGYESAVWGATLSEAIDYGSSDYIGRVKEYIDPEVYHQALLYSIPSIAASGSIQALDNILTELTPDEIIIAKSDFIQTFLRNFTLPTPLDQSLSTYSTVLFDRMKSLDSRWYLFDRNGQDIIDLKYMTILSDDARKTLELHDIIGVAIQMAPSFPDKSSGEVVREQYPLMVDLG